MVAIAGDDAVLADGQRRLQADRDRLLADIEMAEAADQAETVKLPGPLLEAANEQHLAVEFEHLVLRRLVGRRLGRTFAIGNLGRRGGRLSCGAFRRCCLGHYRLSPRLDGWRSYGEKRPGAQPRANPL